MSVYDEFIDCENADIIIKSKGVAVEDPDTYEITYPETIVFDNRGIYYELTASEQIARQQIQKAATGQVILNPKLITTRITDKMDIYITSELLTSSKYRIVTVKNPLGLDDAIYIDVIED